MYVFLGYWGFPYIFPNQLKKKKIISLSCSFSKFKKYVLLCRYVHTCTVQEKKKSHVSSTWFDMNMKTKVSQEAQHMYVWLYVCDKTIRNG